jgi:CSLREA domain-containing protein
MLDPRRVGCAVATVILALAAPPTTRAATFVVTTTADAVDTDPGDGVCAIEGGGCSLRAAILEANALPGADLITLPAGVYTLSIPGVGDDDGVTGDLDVSDTVVIEGDAAATTIVDGGGIDRVFDLGADTTIRRLTIRGGNAATNGENGGGVRATPLPPVEAMTVVLEDVIVTGNDASNGGGIANELGSALVLRRSTLTDNSATVGGADSTTTRVTAPCSRT